MEEEERIQRLKPKKSVPSTPKSRPMTARSIRSTKSTKKDKEMQPLIIEWLEQSQQLERMHMLDLDIEVPLDEPIQKQPGTLSFDDYVSPYWTQSSESASRATEKQDQLMDAKRKILLEKRKTKESVIIEQEQVQEYEYIGDSTGKSPQSKDWHRVRHVIYEPPARIEPIPSTPERRRSTSKRLSFVPSTIPLGQLEPLPKLDEITLEHFTPKHSESTRQPKPLIKRPATAKPKSTTVKKSMIPRIKSAPPQSSGRIILGPLANKFLPDLKEIKMGLFVDSR
ncbi:hypothetical protein EDD86DRAFT_219708 [Gorgonomyces haynaldii]|nr:hypothetical protein EDD86DRAFT_219708 [Gorgonomyces haynaldii]